MSSELFKMFLNILVNKTDPLREDDPFRGQYLRPKCISSEFQKAQKWKKITFYGVFPVLFVVAAFVTLADSEKERPPFVKYEYMRIRRKRFPWGEGNKTFFHNPEVNALPDGYEKK